MRPAGKRYADCSILFPMRAAVIAASLVLAGCEAARVYFHESAGISPFELAPLAAQERQYVNDRNLETKVKSVVPGVEVEVYLMGVTLKGASPSQLDAVRRIPGVKSVRAE